MTPQSIKPPDHAHLLLIAHPVELHLNWSRYG
jgi:hypothetical protein